MFLAAVVQFSLDGGCSIQSWLVDNLCDLEREALGSIVSAVYCIIRAVARWRSNLVPVLGRLQVVSHDAPARRWEAGGRVAVL